MILKGIIEHYIESYIAHVIEKYMSCHLRSIHSSGNVFLINLFHKMEKEVKASREGQTGKCRWI